MSSLRAPLLLSTAAAVACAFAVVPTAVHATTAFRPDEPPEPHASGGWYWGSIDANIDWCERNYSTTLFVAEFWNAISSIPIFLFALAGIVLGKRYAKIELRFVIGYAIMMIVGIGSFMFHATLRRYAQCMDELPMLYASIVLFYNTLDHAPRGFGGNLTPSGGVPASRRQLAAAQPFWTQVQYRIGLKVLLLTAGVVLTGIYFLLPSWFTIFFVGYSTFLMSFVAIMGYHILFSSRSGRRHEGLSKGAHGYEPVSVNDPASSSDPALAQAASHASTRPWSPVLGTLYYIALLGYFGGFVFWGYENSFCSTLPEWAQLHALWHLMAGLGTFAAIQCQIAWRGEEMGGRTSIDFEAGGKILPIVVVKYDQ